MIISGAKTKFFELDACQNAGKVCLVYTERQKEELFKLEESSIWFLDRSYCWHFLAESFSKYFRMMLVHLGLPQWQFLFTSMGPTPWVEVSGERHNINFLFRLLLIN